MPGRRIPIFVFLLTLGWLLASPAGRSFAFDSRKADSLYRSLSRPQTDTQRIKLLLALSHTYESDSPARSFYYASEALFLSERNGWQKGISAAALRIAIVYIDVWELNEAIRHLHSSISAARKEGNEHTERSCWQYLVHCYDHIGKHQEAFDCQKQLLNMVLKTGDTVAICRQMSAYATTMYDNGRTQEGIHWLKKDIALAGAHLHGASRNDISAELLNTLAIVYLKEEHSDSALSTLRAALPLAAAISDTPNMAYLLSTLSFAHSASGTDDSAVYYSLKTIALGKRLNDLPLLKNHHSQLSQLYERHGDAARALYHYKIADSLAAGIAASEKTLEQSMQISRVAIEQQRAQRKQERLDLEAVNANQRKALFVAAGVLIALSVIAALVFRNLRNRERSHKIISAQAESLKRQNKVIDTALQEKEVLLQEMHHRVKNNLQLINGLLELQITKLADKKSAEPLLLAQQRIYSMAMVHTRLYHSSGDASVAVHEFVTDLFHSLNSAFNKSETDIRFTDQVSVTHLPLNMLVPLGLIINELITNSFKHAFPNHGTGTISIVLRKEPDYLVFIYTDTGKGMETNLPDESAETLGLYLIRRLTRQLSGQVVYSSENGPTFTFTFPYEGDPDSHSRR